MGNRNGIISLALALTVTASQLSASEGWHETYEDAVAASEEHGLPLLMHFYASYCGPCQQMKRQVFSESDVQEQLQNGVVAVEVDVTLRPDLASRYGASTIPRDVVVYVGQSPETLGVGFKSRLSYLELLRNVSATGARSRASIAKTESPPVIDESEAEVIVGLEGFCPVRLMRDREWVSGSTEVAEEYRGVTYYFSSEELRDEFRKDARKYTPQNLGCDPVVLYDNQRAITGKIKYGAFFDKQLFLFDSADNRGEFKQNPLKYARIQHAVKVDDIAGQRYH